MLKVLLACVSLSVAYLAMTTVVYAEMPVPPVPRDSYVLDQTGTLTSEQLTALNDKIKTYRERTGVQLAVLMVPEITEDEYLERFSLNVARTWGIGEKDKNNGALLLIAKNDRKLRIEVGTGLEGDLTDARAGRIISDRIAPEFRKGKFFEGISSGLEGMTLAIGETADPQLSSKTTGNNWFSNIGNVVEIVTFVGFFAITWLGSILGRTKSWWAGGILGAALGGLGAFFMGGGTVITVLAAISLAGLGLGFDYLVSKDYKRARNHGSKPSWWAGGTTLGGGGSSGGGFGGGSFGGGGASGSW